MFLTTPPRDLHDSAIGTPATEQKKAQRYLPLFAFDYENILFVSTITVYNICDGGDFAHEPIMVHSVWYHCERVDFVLNSPLLAAYLNDADEKRNIARKERRGDFMSLDDGLRCLHVLQLVAITVAFSWAGRCSNLDYCIGLFCGIGNQPCCYCFALATQ